MQRHTINVVTNNFLKNTLRDTTSLMFEIDKFYDFKLARDRHQPQIQYYEVHATAT